MNKVKLPEKMFWIRPGDNSPIRPLAIEELFDEKTMSVHLKENVIAMAKKGTPGNVKYTKVSKERYTREKLEEIRDEIIKKTKSDKQTFLEDRKD